MIKAFTLCTLGIITALSAPAADKPNDSIPPMTSLKTLISSLLLVHLCLSATAANNTDQAPFDRDWVPQPVFDKEPGYVDLYWTAWEQAWDHVAIQEGLPQSPYMDEAFATSHVWIWDTAFMVLFCKYSPEQFPGVETLNNFYEAFHSKEYSNGNFPLGIQHPDNPPLFAWAEYGNYLFTGDDAHARTLLTETQYLQTHFDWFDNLEPGWRFETQQGQSAEVTLIPKELGYQWSGCSSGMDNTPRERESLWVDAIAQQGLSALAIYRMAESIGEDAIAAEWKTKYDAIKAIVNTYYWDEEDGFYYDISEDGSKHFKVKTPASYWPLLAEMASPEQAARMAEHLRDPETFGGIRPWVTVARNDRHYYGEDGAYWRGGIWLPTAYMGTKAIEKYGYQAEADEAAENLLAHMYRTYQAVEPQTIWECYSPSRDYPVVRRNGHIVRKDFCGWSALGPISMFIENVLGFHTVDAKQQRVEWRLHQQERHGINNFKFGETVTDILYDGAGTVSVSSNTAFELVINGTTHAIPAGNTTLSVEVPSAKEFPLNVLNANGSGSYARGSVLSLNAPDSKDGKKFYNWTSSAGIIDSPDSETTLFWMPAESTTVTANYKTICTVKFVIPDTLKRTGGGALEQLIAEGKAAEAPTIQAGYGWAFEGWDRAFDQITGDIVITAIVVPSKALLSNGDFASSIKEPAKWDEFTVQTSELDLWYIPLFNDRFRLAEHDERAPYLITGGMTKGTNFYQTLSAPSAGNYTFGFDYKSKGSNQLSWAVWGYTADAKDERLTYGGEFNTLAQLPQSGILIASGDFTTGSTEWQSHKSEAFKLTDSFERVVIGIRVNGVDAKKGDRVAIDAVAFDAAEGN